MKLQANLQLVGHDPIILILESSVMDGSQLHPLGSCFLNAPPEKKKLKKQTKSRIRNYINELSSTQLLDGLVIANCRIQKP